MIRWLRRLHTFLGVFFSPLLLLFVITGWWQTVSPNRNKGLGFGASWIEKLSSILVDNYFPLSGARNYWVLGSNGTKCGAPHFAPNPEYNKIPSN